MYLRKPEKFKTLYVDPGETVGWCLGNGPKLLAAGQEDLWPFADAVWASLRTGGSEGFLGADSAAVSYTRKGVGVKAISLPIGRIVCEDFRLYPSHLDSLAWDPVRTARLIGALHMQCRQMDIPFVLQPASIKDQAKLGGAEELFYRPLHENRHMNDSIMHWVYFTTFGPDGDTTTPNNVGESPDG
jgi:hypothetical protein